ncbi:MAG: glycosyltransferase N-terminal domain-containing protein [Acidobacteriota bacterium]
MAEPDRSGLGSRGLRRLYDALVMLVTWGGLAPFECLRIVAGRSSRAILAERLGAVALPSPRGRRLVIHAVSAGEVGAARTLAAALGATAADLSFVLTTGNHAGRRAALLAQASNAAIEGVAYLPWDRRAALRSWLDALRPAAVVIVETEIWPSLFCACGELRIPLLVVSGRIFPRDLPRYRLARGFFRRVFHHGCWIGAQNEREREAFIAIGAAPEQVEALGNLKLDAAPASTPLPEHWRASLARRPLVVAGSTHDPEEAMLTRCLAGLRAQFPSLRLVLAPRHTGRAGCILRDARAQGWRAVLWSDALAAAVDWDLLVVDEMGPLASLYAYADLAFIGGSLVPRGGHNPLEAAAQACATVIGPSFESFQDAVRSLEEAGGIRVLRPSGQPEAALASALAELLADEPLRLAIGFRGAAYCASQGGVSRRYVEAILARLPPA